MDTILHLHTENSIRECALKPESVIKRAKELGYKRASIADHGNMTGVLAFYRAALAEGIDPILGAECNICIHEDINDTAKLVVLAKDRAGYRALCKIVSEGNLRLDHSGLPVISWKRFLEFFSANGYAEHVVVLTGGESGLPAYILNQRIQMKDALLRMESAAGPRPEDDIIQKEKALLELEREIKELILRRDELKKRSGRVFDKRIEKAERVRSMGDEAGYQSMMDDIRKDMEKAGQEKKEYEKIRKTITSWRKLASDMKRGIQTSKENLKAWERKQRRIRQLRGRIQNSRGDISQLKECMRNLQDIFGENLFFEITYHGRENEKNNLQMILPVCRELGIGSVLSNEPYMPDESGEEIFRLHLVRSLSENSWVPIKDGEDAFGMLSSEELSDRMKGIISDKELQRAMKNTDRIGQTCRLRFEESISHYPRYKVPEGENAATLLERLARQAIAELFPGKGWSDAYEDRLKYEISVINGTGYADYTLNVKKILDLAREKECANGYRGCTIGPGRGSGAGSLVNYLLGITNVDPIHYDLIFERYLNLERISPPDIDSDIATSIRDSLLQGIREDYSAVDGKVGVCSIMTKLTLAAKASIRAAGRIISSKNYGSTTSLADTYDAMSKMIPCQVHVRISDAKNLIQERFGTDPDAMEILHAAELIEGTVHGYGTHAAGVIISDNGDVTDYAPLLNVGTSEEPVWNIQCDMGEAEKLGLLKMDMLGLTTLDVIDQTIALVYQMKGQRIDIHHLPFEKDVFTHIYSAGKTGCIFQCESAGMKKMWKELGPDCIEDIIAGIALYRPGPMEFIPEYIRGKHYPDEIRYKTEALKPILEKTYGCIIYQEQVMRIVRELAGFSMGRADLVRRAMSKKKADILIRERKNFVYGNRKEYEAGEDEQYIPGCVENGISACIADSIYDDMIDFAKYAFNKSHAAAYALVSYQTAWLKYHYPLEFMCACLNLARPEKYQTIINECREMGIQVRNPDINTSQEQFSICGENMILYGLAKIKNVKKDAAKIIEQRMSPFESVTDFLIRVKKINRTSVEAMLQGGVFDRFVRNRRVLSEKLGTLSDRASRIQACEEKLSEAKDRQRDKGISQKEMKKLCDRIRVLDTRIRHFRQEMEEIERFLHESEADGYANPAYEKEVLCAYVGSHPLDLYEKLLPKERQQIQDTVEAYLEGRKTGIKVVMYGTLSDLNYVRRKKDGIQMAVFDLADRSGKVRVILSSKTFRHSKSFLKEGAAIRAEGMLQKDKQETDVAVLFAGKLVPLEMDVKQILLFADSSGWEKELEPFLVSQGQRLILYDCERGQFLDSGLFLSSEVWKSPLSEKMCEVHEILRLSPRCG